MSTARPAKDNKFAFQPASFCLTLCKMKLQSWEEAPECLIGIPRYFPRFGVDANPRMSHSDSLVSLSTFGEKQTLDLAQVVQLLACRKYFGSIIEQDLACCSLLARTRGSSGRGLLVIKLLSLLLRPLYEWSTLSRKYLLVFILGLLYHLNCRFRS